MKRQISISYRDYIIIN